MPRPSSLILLAFALPLACGEVSIKPDSRSGPDFEKAGALQLQMNKLTDDFVDGGQGDNTDWKFLKVTAKGILKLVVYWDSKNVDSMVEVRDRFGVLLQNFTHSAELEKDEIEFPVDPGTHYVRLYALTKASVYTIEGTFQAWDADATDEVTPEADSSIDLLGEPMPEATAEPRPRASGRSTPRPARAPAAAPSSVVTGTIFRVLPAAGGKSATLTMNVGDEKGATIGSTGDIYCPTGGKLDGGRFRIDTVLPKTAKATVMLTVEKIGNCRDVKVNIQ